MFTPMSNKQTSLSLKKKAPINTRLKNHRKDANSG